MNFLNLPIPSQEMLKIASFQAVFLLMASQSSSAWVNFLIGGVSGMVAVSVNQPMDYIKVHLQVAREGKAHSSTSALSFARESLHSKGWKAFYTGLDSALVKQALYTTVRLGLYRSLCDWNKAKTGQTVLPFWKKVAYSCVAGMLGALVGNPADLALVRLQTDQTLPVAQRRHYKHVLDALARIPKEEGILAYWRGSLPTVIRASFINIGMLAPYDQTKEFLDLKLGFHSSNRFLASIVAAMCACVISLPFDNVKTKIQRMAKAEGSLPYTGFVDCVGKTARREGLMGFYVGLDAYFLRVAPYTVVALLAQDALHHLYTKFSS